MAAKKRFSVYITESQPDLSGQVPPTRSCARSRSKGRTGLEAIARSQGTPRPAASRAACLPAGTRESHVKHGGSQGAQGLT